MRPPGRPHGWRTLRSRIRYRNAWIAVREDAVVYPDGRPGIYGVVDKGPGICVAPVDRDGGIYLLRQYRYTIDGEAWELPAGSIHPGERETAAARRELREEAALAASRLQRLGSFYTALGHETAEIIAFAAHGLRGALRGPADRQPDESILEVRKVSRADLRRMIRANEIRCGITLATLRLLSSDP